MSSRRSFLQRVLWAGTATCLGGANLWAAPAGGATHRVVRGDTLSEIAQAYGVTVRELKNVNGLTSDLIRVGQELRIPARAGGNVLGPVIAANRRIRINASHWRYIVLHHSAIEKGNAAIYGAAHLRRGMSNGLAYHFVIGNGIDSGDGEIEVGPRWTGQLLGGHVRDRTVNNHGIGICLVGNLENHAPTAKQRASMIALVDYLRGGLVARKCEVTVHKWVDKNHTLCPGRHFPYAEIQRRYRA